MNGFAHDCRGLLEMATGTGKTKTALSASVRLFEREKRLAVIMTVPYQHLVDQWNTESQEFGYRPILAYQSKASWFDKLNSMEVTTVVQHKNVLILKLGANTTGENRVNEVN